MNGHPLWKAFVRRRVFGFHGNTAARIVAAEERGFHRDGLHGDWLGSGLYFWLEAPARAWQWADSVVAREGNERPDESRETPKVILAELEYNQYWIDLIESGPWFDRMKRVARDLERRGALPDQSTELPASVLHRRDFAVIEAAMNMLASASIRVDAIRSAFIEGDPICDRSAIYDKAHVQIAVRNPGIIGDYVSIERDRAN